MESWQRNALHEVWKNDLDVDICFVPSKDERNFQPTAEGLVEQKSGLEGRDEREPWQECYRSKNDHAHPSVVQSAELTDRVPQSEALDDLLPSDSQLIFSATKKDQSCREIKPESES